MMQMDDMENKFEIEDNTNSKVKYGNEVGNPPLVVVVQGGRNVKYKLLIF